MLLSTFQEVSGLKMNEDKTDGMEGTSSENTAKFLAISYPANSTLMLTIKIWYNNEII